MDSNDCVEQKGIIEEISHGVATVNITSFSACSSCESKAACGMSETSEKKIQVVLESIPFKEGELVKILMKKSLGLKATLLAYVLPFMLVIIALIVLKNLDVAEAISGLIAIIALAVYFFVLHLYKDKLRKTFQFTLNKVN